MAGLRIFTNLIPKNERLPKVTGLGGPRIRQSKPINLVNPDFFTSNNPAIKANIQKFNLIDPKDLRAATLDRLNASVDAVNAQIEGSIQFKGVRFGVHSESGRHFAVVRDRESGEVLKTIPGEAFLELAARLKDLSGLLVNVLG